MKHLIFFCIISISHESFSQDTISSNVQRNTFFFELGGQGLFYSFSFERLNKTHKKISTPSKTYYIEKKFRTAYSVGFMSSFPDGSEYAFALPMSYNFIWGKRNNHFELGAGITTFFRRQYVPFTLITVNNNGEEFNYSFNAHTDNYHILLTSRLGYRFQKSSGGIYFRVAFTPFFAAINSIDYGIHGGKGSFSKYNYNSRYFEFFKTKNSRLGGKIEPSLGISLGYTFKK